MFIEVPTMCLLYSFPSKPADPLPHAPPSIQPNVTEKTERKAGRREEGNQAWRERNKEGKKGEKGRYEREEGMEERREKEERVRERKRRSRKGEGNKEGRKGQIRR